MLDLGNSTTIRINGKSKYGAETIRSSCAGVLSHRVDGNLCGNNLDENYECKRLLNEAAKNK